MEFGNAESRDEATGLISGCSERGECLIYTEAGDIVGRSCPSSSTPRAGRCASDCTPTTHASTRRIAHLSRPALPAQRRPAPCVCPLVLAFARAGPSCAEGGRAHSRNARVIKMCSVVVPRALAAMSRVAPGWGPGITYDTRPADIMSG